MSIELKNSETKINLMRAFAGESQARNRYIFAAKEAKKDKLQVIEAVFRFTADQEESHAKVFYDFLKNINEETLDINAGYPVSINKSVAALLRQAQHNEYEEYEEIYKSFGEKAKSEGFPEIASAFNNIAEIEKLHGERFGKFADLLENNKLFISDAECKWICLNCGYVYNGKEAPGICPVCKHDKGFFVRLEISPYQCGCCECE